MIERSADNKRSGAALQKIFQDLASGTQRFDLVLSLCTRCSLIGGAVSFDRIHPKKKKNGPCVVNNLRPPKSGNNNNTRSSAAKRRRITLSAKQRPAGTVGGFYCVVKSGTTFQCVYFLKKKIKIKKKGPASSNAATGQSAQQQQQHSSRPTQWTRKTARRSFKWVKNPCVAGQYRLRFPLTQLALPWVRLTLGPSW